MGGARGGGGGARVSEYFFLGGGGGGARVSELFSHRIQIYNKTFFFWGGGDKVGGTGR